MNLEGRCYLQPIMTVGHYGAAAIVFDGDDTLWSTEPLYDRARSAARAEVTSAGLDGKEWELLERRIDVENVRHLGFSTERFPTSCVQAYEVIARASGVLVDEQIRRRVRSAASAVFRQDPVLIPGVEGTLRMLRARGVKLGLLTKGDYDLQRRRVEHSGLSKLFDVVHIVPEKPAAEFRRITAELGVEPENAWSVGNSVRSDILPAIEAGLRAVWIDAHVWEHEQFEGVFAHDQVLVVTEIAGVAEAIEAASMKG